MGDGVSAGAHPLTTDPQKEQLEDALALCLSGGGYRAMLFHLGTLWYLNDAGYLPKLDRVSSVSGGSITAGILGLHWSRLKFDAAGKATKFNLVIDSVRTLAHNTIDASGVIRGILTPFTTVGDRIIASYKKLVFGDATLQSLPDKPLFVINATNVQTGSLFRFSKPYLGDWRIGMIDRPATTLAQAVAASSAFPPILSPARLTFQHNQWHSLNPGHCGKVPFTTNVVLTDGGVYDNMGLENPWKRCKKVLVSDGGGKYQPEADPHSDWPRHALRINATIDNQVRSLRKRQIVSAFLDQNDEHSGAYWGMWTTPSDYPVTSKLPIPADRGLDLARTPTRLAAMPPALQNRIINFGYGMAERAIRSYYDKTAFAPDSFPCAGGV
ncbi:MAG TPA: patatin-like phospholipase family protein [Thermoanaerobaculia bacterium]